MNTLKKITATVFALALISLTFQNCKMASGGSGNDVGKVLHAVADSVNKACPMNVDKDTRLDNTVVMPGNSFMYSYTLVNYDKSQVDTNQLRTYIQPRVVENMKTNPDMKFMRDNKVTLIYEYKDKNGAFLFKVAAAPAQYLQ